MRIVYGLYPAIIHSPRTCEEILVQQLIKILTNLVTSMFLFLISPCDRW